MTSLQVRQYFDRLRESRDSYSDSISEENQLSERNDLCAFLIISKLLHKAKTRNIISGASHDEIYLSLTPDDIPNEQTLLDLYHCGVLYDGYYEHFYMFV